jgi:hypothetical protein
MSILPSQRKLVRERAGNCCEYCRLAATSGTVAFHIDHIIPIKHDGSNNVENLCLACYNCNAFKSHDLTGFDPATGEIARIYHPRIQVWSEHFALEPDMWITGLTPEGRTTVRVLQMNLDERVESRQALAAIDEYPCSVDSAE